jgi:hypothetical protein
VKEEADARFEEALTILVKSWTVIVTPLMTAVSPGSISRSSIVNLRRTVDEPGKKSSIT